VAVIPGHIEDEVVIVGNHRDGKLSPAPDCGGLINQPGFWAALTRIPEPHRNTKSSVV